MTGYLLIVAHEEPDEMHYPTTEERERAFSERATVNAAPSLLGLFPTEAAAQQYVVDAQIAGDPGFFGKGCFATVPVETFATASEVITEGF